MHQPLKIQRAPLVEGPGPVTKIGVCKDELVIEGFSRQALTQLQGALGPGVGGGVSVTVVDFGPLVAALNGIAQSLNTIAEALTNPEATAADEKYRKGVLAYTNGWWSDALEELDASIEMHRYRAGPHLVRGLTHLQLAETGSALDDLAASVKYGSAAEPRAAVTAALIAAPILDSVGRPEGALDILASARGLGVSVQLLGAIASRSAGSPERAAELLAVIEQRPLINIEPYQPLVGEVLAQRGHQLREAHQDLVEAASETIDASKALDALLSKPLLDGTDLASLLSLVHQNRGTARPSTVVYAKSSAYLALPQAALGERLLQSRDESDIHGLLSSGRSLLDFVSHPGIRRVQEAASEALEARRANVERLKAETPSPRAGTLKKIRYGIDTPYQHHLKVLERYQEPLSGLADILDAIPSDLIERTNSATARWRNLDRHQGSDEIVDPLLDLPGVLPLLA